MQMTKDIELMNTPGSGVDTLEWHFFQVRLERGPLVPSERP